MNHGSHPNETILQAKVDRILLKQWDWALEKMGKTRRGRIIEILKKDIKSEWTPEMETAFKQMYGALEGQPKEKSIEVK